MDSQSKPKPRLARSVLAYRGMSFSVPEWLEIGQSFFLPCLKAEELGGKVRGMPALGLSEVQIDQIIAYLLERK